MNKVILMGRLTRDPDVRYSNQGGQQMAVARYTLAVDRRSRQGQEADFIGCVAFNRSAEFAEQYLRKGMKIVITGRIQTGSYTGKEGTKIYTTDVVIEEQEFAESKAASGGNSQNNRSGYDQNGGNRNYDRTNNGAEENHYNSQNGYRPSPQTAAGDDFMNIPDGIDDEGLPFN